MGEEFQVWKDHFISQARGNLPHQKGFYNVSEQLGQGGSASIKLVSPTQQVVERAKSTLSNSEDMQAPTIYDPVTGVMQSTSKKHSKIKSHRKRKSKTQISKTKSKKRRTSKKKVKKRRKNKKNNHRRKNPKTKKKRSGSKW